MKATANARALSSCHQCFAITNLFLGCHGKCALNLFPNASKKSQAHCTNLHYLGVMYALPF